MRKYRVLLVVMTEDAGKWSHEIELISSQHTTTVIADTTIDSDRIHEAAGSHNYDIVHFLVHCGERGIVTNQSDGRLPYSTLLRIVRDSGAKTVFLNSCLTATIGQRLVDDGVPSTLCYINNVLDDVALSVARSFYRAVLHADSPREAYNDVGSNEGKFIWLSNGKWEKIDNKILLDGFALLVSRLNMITILLIIMLLIVLAILLI